jgi:amino acid adenylation domain-containing protein
VGILASRSWPAYAGVLGANWIGAAYVPLNPDWPAQRLASILKSVELDALVVDDRGLKALTADVVKQGPARILAAGRSTSFDLQSSAGLLRVAGFDSLPDFDAKQVPKELSAEDLAYIMFTSGTTGIPKGVMVSTGNVRSFLAAMRNLYGFTALDRISQNYDLTFDPSVMDMFTAWSCGASVQVTPAGQLMGPARFIRERQITCWFSVPSTISFMRNMKMLTSGAFRSVRYSVFCGEPLPASSAEAWRCAAPNSCVDNLYGPTEATVVCIGQRCTDPLVVTEGRGTVAIGRPLQGMDAAIVDTSLGFRSTNEKGELAVSGGQVTQGYFGHAEKTADRFPNIGGRVWYLTGDLAYRDSNGLFHHLGRIDNQVKVLGNRVELEDVEAHLRGACGVDSVAAVAWPDVEGNAKGIVAFVAGCASSTDAVREAMRLRVPKYMVPSQIIFVSELPLSASGKVDRAALTEMISKGQT